MADDDYSYYSSSDEEDELDQEERELMTPEEIAAFKKQQEEARAERRAQKEAEDAQKDAEEEGREYLPEEELWNFPPDREHWTEQDLGEVWCDAYDDAEAVGWDPELIDSEEVEKLKKAKAEGQAVPNAPFYMPYRRYYPCIPENNFDIQTPEDVVEELERIEEFLEWASFVFEDGSSYEGTIWDDQAHGKGVYVTGLNLCRYEGEWVSNMMQGHGVLEVDLPVSEPPPDSEEAKKMKAQGAILRSDYMNEFDREWLKMDIEDTKKMLRRTGTSYEDLDIWEKHFGEKPEKGRYRYAGQWKHSRFHGCGVYELNGDILWGKFYFGDLLPDPGECDISQAELHSGLAEVAAAKARMFANKPDGMVREINGPYTDPSHPYMYEEEDLWMAPGFVNAYYEVPKEWQVYVEELDKERELWLNSFYKAPFVVPMPPEMEYWWSKGNEFVLLGNNPNALLSHDPENVLRSEDDLQGEVLLHVPTGRIINWAEDENGHLRLFLQPVNGEFDPDAIVPLPLGFDDYFKDETEVSAQAVKKKNIWERLKEAWQKSKEEFEQKKSRKLEELKNKLKQEDEAREMQRKLREMEIELSVAIEREKLYAQYLDLRERMAAKKKADEGKGEEASQAELSKDGREESQHKEGERVQFEEGEGIQREEGEKEVDMEEEESNDEDEDEDDGKPTSFGKVAMMDLEDEHDYVKPRDPFFPTAFASLSFCRKAVMGDMLNMMTDLRSKCHIKMWGNVEPSNLPMTGLKFRKFWTRSEDEKLNQGPNNMPMTGLKFGKLCTHSKDINLRLACASHQKVQRQMVTSTKGRQAAHFGRFTCRKYGQKSTAASIDHQSVWSTPEFTFMSLALPINIRSLA